MSGTSCDGVSVALARFQGRTLRVIAERTTPYPQRLVRRLRAGPSLRASDLAALNMELGERFAQAAIAILRRARISSKRITVIGSHGHTVYHGPHDPLPSTLQIGEAAVIAQRTGIPVVANFRPRDVAAGGEGAPLIPFFDETFFGNGPARALQNLGGIANVTVVGKGLETFAFDTGPGNCLLDEMVQHMTRGRLRYDPHGQLALRGRIDHRTVARLWQQPYFRRPPPKSTGRELFNTALLRELFGKRLTSAPHDVLATLTYGTAYTIAESYRRFVPRKLREVIVSGGGVRNRTLLRHLARLMAPVPVRTVEQFGIPTQAKEPLAFAYLGLCAIRRRANHLPRTTGARVACILGTITPGVKN